MKLAWQLFMGLACAAWLGAVAIKVTEQRTPFKFMEDYDWRLATRTERNGHDGPQYIIEGSWPEIEEKARKEFEAMGYEPLWGCSMSRDVTYMSSSMFAKSFRDVRYISADPQYENFNQLQGERCKVLITAGKHSTSLLDDFLAQIGVK